MVLLPISPLEALPGCAFIFTSYVRSACRDALLQPPFCEEFYKKILPPLQGFPEILIAVGHFLDPIGSELYATGI